MISIGSFLYGNMPIFLEINKHIFHIFVPIGIAQMLAKGEFEDLSEARACVRESFDIGIYQ